MLKIDSLMYKFFLFFLVLVWLSNSSLAQKTDTIYLYNGDRITGEIKQMVDNKLSYKTDRAGTISIEWPSIVKISSREFFKIYLGSGEIIYGNLHYGSEDGRVTVNFNDIILEKNMHNIVALDKIKIHFFEQISGSVFLNGFYTKANNNLQLNTGFDISHKNLNLINSLKASTFISSTNNFQDLIRNDASYSLARFFDSKTYFISFLQYQKNSELNIGSRYQMLLGGGYYLLRKPSNEISLLAGISLNNETPFIDASSVPTRNMEIAVGGFLHRFKFRNPKIDLLANFTTFKSITNWQRIRFDSDFVLEYEIIKDLNINITLYTNYDNKPPGEGPQILDWNVTTGLKYNINP